MAKGKSGESAKESTRNTEIPTKIQKGLKGRDPIKDGLDRTSAPFKKLLPKARSN